MEGTDSVKHSTLAYYGTELNAAMTRFMKQGLEGTHFEIEKPRLIRFGQKYKQAAELSYLEGRQHLFEQNLF